jgi:glycosyltransferase involved in cell wall biosynthesis
MNISVCMASYNGEKFIKRQLNSILSQLNTGDEVIISDDSSTDNTIAIIESIDDSRIKIFKNNKFYNPTYNFENALKHASHNLIFLADQDDYWHNNKVEIMKNLLSNYDLVVSDCLVIDESGNIIHDSFLNYVKAGKGIFRNLYRNPYSGCCMAFNRTILDKALPIPPNTPMHDWWIGMIAELYGNIYFCNEKLMSYVRHSTNASESGFKSSNQFRKKLKMRINLIINLAGNLQRYPKAFLHKIHRF